MYVDTIGLPTLRGTPGAFGFSLSFKDLSPSGSELEKIVGTKLVGYSFKSLMNLLYLKSLFSLLSRFSSGLGFCRVRVRLWYPQLTANTTAAIL